MPNEVTVTGRLQSDNGNAKTDKRPGALQFDQSAKGSKGGTQKIGTSAEGMEMGDLATHGRAWFRNLDDTNFIDLGPDKGSTTIEPGIRLKPGFPAGPFFISPGSTWLAEADTAECLMEVSILEA